MPGCPLSLLVHVVDKQKSPLIFWDWLCTNNGVDMWCTTHAHAFYNPQPSCTLPPSGQVNSRPEGSGSPCVTSRCCTVFQVF